MKILNATLIAAATALVLNTGALGQGLSKVDRNAAQEKIAADYQSAQAACSSSSGNAKAICMTAATGKEKVATAELTANYLPGAKANRAVKIAKADADYALASEKCSALLGQDKKPCADQAKSEQTEAKKKPDASSSAAQSADEYLDDALISSKVKAAILDESLLNSAQINVETNKGIVQLNGVVRSHADSDKAVALARGVKGVGSVQNNLIAKAPQ